MSKCYFEIGSESLSYPQLAERTAQMRSRFSQLAFEPGDTVVVSCTHDPYTVVLTLAALDFGLTVVLVDPTVKFSRLQNLVSSCHPKGWIIDKTLQEPWQIQPDFKVQWVDAPPSGDKPLLGKLFGRKTGDPNHYPSVLDQLKPSTQPVAAPSHDQPALLLYTSGTTSDSKGVIITHGNLQAHLATLRKVYAMNEQSNIQNVLSLYHADGFIQGPLLARFCQATLHRPCKFNLENLGTFCDNIYKMRITHAIVAPMILAFLHRYSDGLEETFLTPDFKALVSVSAHLEEKLWREFSEKFEVRVSNVYGLTETVAGSIFSGPSDELYKLGTIGKPVDCDAKIIDAEGQEVGPNVTGELLLRGPHVSPGYLNNESSTAAMFKDGWLHTGDLADRDSQGFYRILGRLRNLVVSGGFAIYPEEVSEVLNRHPEVIESVSFGVADEVYGERLVSCVVPKNATTTVQSLLDFCRANIEPEKVPRQIVLVESLTKGLSGKIQLKEVRAHFEKSNGGLFSTIVEQAAQIFQVPKESLDRHSNGHNVAGWDSLAHLDLVESLEKTFSVRFSPSEVMVMDSLLNIENVLKNHVKDS